MGGTPKPIPLLLPYSPNCPLTWLIVGSGTDGVAEAPRTQGNPTFGVAVQLHSGGLKRFA